MIITEPGKYRVLENCETPSGIYDRKLFKGEVIYIDSVDVSNKKIISVSHNICSSNNLPVEKVKE